jgi:type II secretory ATPase GspE/PulE/Tfp pilus assembly ATPase PilB-like protein
MLQEPAQLNALSSQEPATEPPPGVSQAGLLSELDCARAVTDARAAQVPLAQWLMSHGATREDTESTLTSYYGLPFFRFDERTSIPDDLKRQLRPEFLREICAVPVEHHSSHVVVVMEDPGDLIAFDQLLALAGKQQLFVHVGMRDEILAFIDAAYGLGGQIKDILVQLGGTEQDHVADEQDEAGEIDEADSAVIKLANQLIIDGVRRGASDIHVEPNGNDRPMRVRLRIDGDCIEYQEVPARFRRALVARLKIMARLDISERRKPQDGKIRFLIGKRTVELRVASYPTASGDEDVVMRILPGGKPIALAQMYMSPANYAAFTALIRRPYGLILCVGPTGSGKTTTLHSALGEINHADIKICTAEDPVEITQPGLRQLQVLPRIGLTFEAALRSFLRADPDVIMIGEMRDRETAQVAVEASLTGHLVFSTLHTNTAPETITRLVDIGLDPFTFADSLLGVLAQRLTGALCVACRERCALDGEEHQQLNELALASGVAEAVEPPWRARGCERCHGRGYRGRLALHELLVIDDPLRIAIGRRTPIEELRVLAVTAGMRTLLQDGVEKVQQGLTDLQQVLMVCSR